MFNSGASQEDVIPAVVCFFYWIFNNMLKEGHVENVVNLISQEGMSLWGMKWGLMKTMMPIMQTLNAGRSRGMFVVNAISFFAMLFKLASNFLDATTLAKLNVTTADTSESITLMIAPE